MKFSKNHIYFFTKSLFFLGILFYCFSVKGQNTEVIIAMNNESEKPIVSESTRKTFKGSESSEYTFIVNSNIRENIILIETNYERSYKVRFIDYYGGSRKVYKDVYLNKEINIEELGLGIFIMNITDAKNNKLLTSQVINLKRRYL